MAWSGEFRITPQLSGLEELTGQLRRTGEALIGLADSIDRLSEGVSPDAARVRPEPEYVCPFVSNRTVHDAHMISVTSLRPGTVDTETVTFDCPGWPVRPWYGHTDTS